MRQQPVKRSEAHQRWQVLPYSRRPIPRPERFPGRQFPGSGVKMFSTSEFSRSAGRSDVVARYPLCRWSPGNLAPRHRPVFQTKRQPQPPAAAPPLSSLQVSPGRTVSCIPWRFLTDPPRFRWRLLRIAAVDHFSPSTPSSSAAQRSAFICPPTDDVQLHADHLHDGSHRLALLTRQVNICGTSRSGRRKPSGCSSLF